MDDRTEYLQGVADTGAALIGMVAAELGYEHPLIDRMVQRLGQLGQLRCEKHSRDLHGYPCAACQFE